MSTTSSTTTTATFDLPTLSRAIADRDAETQLAMYAPSASVAIADRITQPGSPRVLSGSAEIGAWLHDLCDREMTHVVQHSVSDATGAAFTEACRYPDGTNVLCATVLECSDGLIQRQTIVQAWDER
jgi:hypothetical protein